MGYGYIGSYLCFAINLGDWDTAMRQIKQGMLQSKIYYDDISIEEHKQKNYEDDCDMEFDYIKNPKESMDVYDHFALEHIADEVSGWCDYSIVEPSKEVTTYYTATVWNQERQRPLNKMYIKQWGFEYDTKMLLCYGKCFRGGYYWEHQEIDTQYMNELKKQSAQIQDKMDRFCEKYDFNKNGVQWLNVIATGQCIY